MIGLSKIRLKKKMRVCHVTIIRRHTPPGLPLLLYIASASVAVLCVPGKVHSFLCVNASPSFRMAHEKQFRLLICCLLLSTAMYSTAKPAYHTKAFNSWLERLSSDLHNKVLSSGTCEACKLFTVLAQAIFMTKTNDVLYLASVLCIKLKIEDHRVCAAAVKEFQVEVLTVFDDVFLSPDEVCGRILGPTCAHARNPDFFWNITLPGTKKPPVKPIPAPKVIPCSWC